MRKLHLLLLVLLLTLIGSFSQGAKAHDASPKDNPPLTVTATKSGDNAIISWTTASKTATYDVVRAKTNAEGTEIISEETIATGITENQFTDETWQNEEVGNYYKWGVKYSEAKENPQEIIIGTGTDETFYNPVEVYCKYSISQQIYTASEIGMTGQINSIGFNISYSQNTIRNIQIYIKRVEINSFPNSNMISVGDNDLYYEGSFNLSDNGWTTLSLDRPFLYAGGNLLVCVNDITGSKLYYDCYFYATAVYNSEIHNSNNYFSYEPEDPGSGSQNHYRPNLKLTIESSTQQTYWSNVLHNKWYNVSIKSGIQNGTISANANIAQVGQTIVITATPDENYHLKSLYYYPDDDATNITEIDMTTMQFPMPEKDITVNAEFERNLVTYNVYVKDILDKPIEGATVTISNSCASYSANTTFQGWATLHIPSGSYNYSVSKEGYYDIEPTYCQATTFEVVLHEKQDAPSHFYVSATGWAMWSPFYNGEKDILGYKIRTEDYWGIVEEINVATPYHQFDVSKYYQSTVYNVYVAAVYTGDVVSIYNNTEWGYMPCYRYNNVNNFLAEITDNNVSMTWTQPDPKPNHTLLGYMVFRGNKLLTQSLLGTDVTSFADDSEEASGSSTYCVKAVYNDTEDEYNGHFCMSCGSYMKPNEAYHWNGNEHQQVNSITVTAVIKINDVEQRTSALEVGAFCGEQCRGAKRAIHFSATDKFIATFNVYGKEGDKIKFRLYDHSQGKELEYKCKSNFTFEPSTMLGNTEEPYEINFYSAVTQSQSLAAGNNWYSSFVTLDGKTGLQLIENGLASAARNIKSQTSYTTFINNGSWFGALNEASNREMYIINMESAHSLSINGPSVEPAEVQITTHQGWNWIGYPVENELNVNTALSSLHPSVGDKIKSQSQQSEYGANGWAGELTTMTAGQGYMYYQKAAGTKILIYNADKSLDKSLNDNLKHRHWNPDIHKYAMNMSVAALIAIDGEVQSNENLEVGAFCNGEVRGSACPIYHEPLGAYIVMLTVHGEDSDDIVFKLYDSENDSEYKSFSKETLKYIDNGIVGSLSEPYTINFGDSSGSGNVNFYPNPTKRGEDIILPGIFKKVEIFNITGTKVVEYQNIERINGIDVAGTYIIRMTDDSIVKYGKLIVE